MSFIAAQINRDGQASQLALALTVELETIRQNMRYSDVTDVTEVIELSKLISDTYNSKITVVINPNIRRNASVSMPLINMNNIMFQPGISDYYGDILEGRALTDLYISSDTILAGGIEKNDRLTGYFSELETTITVSYDLVYNNPNLPITCRSITGIILHEIGHFINFLKATNWTVRGHFIQHQMNEIMMRTSSYKDRLNVLTHISTAENLDIAKDIPELASLQNPKLTTVTVLAANARNMRNELGSNSFDARGFEQLSDNFAAQHGMGMDLALGLELLSSGYDNGKVHTISSAIVRLTETAHLLAAFSESEYSDFLKSILTFLYNPEDTIYDGPHDRAKRISQTMISILKQNPDSINQTLINEIEVINSSLQGYYDDRSDLDILAEKLCDTGKEAKSLRELNQYIDDFSNNRLYIMANKFKNLT